MAVGTVAKLRVEGAEDHDVGEFGWTKTGDNAPFTPLGKDSPDRFTRGVILKEWTAEIEARADGTFAINWDSWQDSGLEKVLVVTRGARSERLTGCVIDSVANSVKAADGKHTKSVKGKARGWSAA